MRRDATPLLLAALLVAGCEGPGPGVAQVTMGPMLPFTREVEPVLEARCAQGSCHGRGDRAFAVYAPGQYRADPSRTYVAEPLGADEVQANAMRLAALVGSGPVEASDALRQPLAVAAGGDAHGGGDVFADTSDSGYRAMLAWLRTCVPTVDGGAR